MDHTDVKTKFKRWKRLGEVVEVVGVQVEVGVLSSQGAVAGIMLHVFVYPVPCGKGPGKIRCLFVPQILSV